ncbi:hypothetical protein ES705_00390 [subsurface metagenome]|nr:hypothetical protein [Clostridia bacterium]
MMFMVIASIIISGIAVVISIVAIVIGNVELRNIKKSFDLNYGKNMIVYESKYKNLNLLEKKILKEIWSTYKSKKKNKFIFENFVNTADEKAAIRRLINESMLNKEGDHISLNLNFLDYLKIKEEIFNV